MRARLLILLGIVFGHEGFGIFPRQLILRQGLSFSFTGGAIATGTRRRNDDAAAW